MNNKIDKEKERMERRIRRLTWCVESWKLANEVLQSENNRLRAVNKSLELRVKNAG